MSEAETEFRFAGPSVVCMLFCCCTRSQNCFCEWLKVSNTASASVFLDYTKIATASEMEEKENLPLLPS